MHPMPDGGDARAERIARVDVRDLVRAAELAHPLDRGGGALAGLARERHAPELVVDLRQIRNARDDELRSLPLALKLNAQEDRLREPPLILLLIVERFI